jgi:hypothetical protein
MRIAIIGAGSVVHRPHYLSAPFGFRNLRPSLAA